MFSKLAANCFSFITTFLILNFVLLERFSANEMYYCITVVVVRLNRCGYINILFRLDDIRCIICIAHVVEEAVDMAFIELLVPFTANTADFIGSKTSKKYSDLYP